MRAKKETISLSPKMHARLSEVATKYDWPKSRIIDLALRMSLLKIEEILNEGKLE